METVTQWFDGGLKPVREGVYERIGEDLSELIFPFYYWNGMYWTAACGETPESAADASVWAKSRRSVCQDWQWRGLAEEP